MLTTEVDDKFCNLYLVSELMFHMNVVAVEIHCIEELSPNQHMEERRSTVCKCIIYLEIQANCRDTDCQI